MCVCRGGGGGGVEDMHDSLMEWCSPEEEGCSCILFLHSFSLCMVTLCSTNY